MGGTGGCAKSLMAQTSVNSGFVMHLESFLESGTTGSLRDKMWVVFGYFTMAKNRLPEAAAGLNGASSKIRRPYPNRSASACPICLVDIFRYLYC